MFAFLLDRIEQQKYQDSSMWSQHNNAIIQFLLHNGTHNQTHLYLKRTKNGLFGGKWINFAGIKIRRPTK